MRRGFQTFMVPRSSFRVDFCGPSIKKYQFFRALSVIRSPRRILKMRRVRWMLVSAATMTLVSSVEGQCTFFDDTTTQLRIEGFESSAVTSGEDVACCKIECRSCEQSNCGQDAVTESSTIMLPDTDCCPSSILSQGLSCAQSPVAPCAILSDSVDSTSSAPSPGSTPSPTTMAPSGDNKSTACKEEMGLSSNDTDPPGTSTGFIVLAALLSALLLGNAVCCCCCFKRRQKEGASPAPGLEVGPTAETEMPRTTHESVAIPSPSAGGERGLTTPVQVTPFTPTTDSERGRAPGRGTPLAPNADVERGSSTPGSIRSADGGRGWSTPGRVTDRSADAGRGGTTLGRSTATTGAKTLLISLEEELEAEQNRRKRAEALVMRHKMGGIRMGDFPNVRDVEHHIQQLEKHAMAWTEKACAIGNSDLATTATVAGVLKGTFQVCLREVQQRVNRRLEHLEKFLGNTEPVELSTLSGGDSMALDTQYVLYECLCRSFRTIVPVDDSGLMHQLAEMVPRGFGGAVNQNLAHGIISGDAWKSFENLMKKYIMVFLEMKLQNPSMECRGGEVGESTAFNARFHRDWAQRLEGPMDKCCIVFPAVHRRDGHLVAKAGVVRERVVGPVGFVKELA